MMPGQNGFDLTREVKKKKNIPIIFLTAKGEVENRIKGLELGADDYLRGFQIILRINNIIAKSKGIDINKIISIGKSKINLNKMNIFRGEKSYN